MADTLVEPSFRFLQTARQQLFEICKKHWSSVWSFQAPDDQPWFLLTSDEPPDDHESGVRHLSSSASCLESLHEAWIVDDEKLGEKQKAQLQAVVDAFSTDALARKQEAWQSEGGGHIYCRVRTLPEILTSAGSDVVEGAKDAIAKHLEFIWSGVTAEVGHQGIWEHNFQLPSAGSANQPEKQLAEPQYPPNAFLTYWGLRTRECAVNRGLCEEAAFDDERKIAQLWIQRSLASQAALAQTSDLADPQQLCWAICGMLRFGDEEELRYPANVDLIKTGLSALFARQSPSGLWARGDALFHYPRSGNAYCFTFETLNELLRVAVEREGPGELLRRLLKPYAEKLFGTAEYAMSNFEVLGEGTQGWSSHHHPQRIRPESWATAATFAFLENLRSLIGVWTAESARRQLKVRTPRWPQREEAVKKLADRGKSWKVDDWDAGELLAALFLHPVSSENVLPERLDPDLPLIPKSHARSAILFGPPGTSKTTLIEALAGSIGWDFLEVHASDFLSLGMNDVPKRADEIFDQIMELDRCVILFDEIDELLRDRGDGSDPFGRFLTTSMLPKLAKLWDQRRVLFFVNTNWIDKADPAIKRSQRFDATIFVMPSGFATKLEAIADLLNEDARRKLSEAEVVAAVEEEKEDALGWLAFVRHDQLATLRTELLRKQNGAPADFDDLKNVLEDLGERLRLADWHTGHADLNNADAGEHGEAHPFARYKELKKSNLFDHSRLRLVFLEQEVTEVPEGFELAVTPSQNGHYLSLSWRVSHPAPELQAESWTADLIQNLPLCYKVREAPSSSVKAKRGRAPKIGNEIGPHLND